MPPTTRYRFHEPNLRSIINSNVEDGTRRLGGLPATPTPESLALDTIPLPAKNLPELRVTFSDEEINQALVRSGVFSFTKWLTPGDNTSDWLNKLSGLCLTRPFGWTKPKNTNDILRQQIRTLEDQVVSFLGDWILGEQRWRERDRPYYNVYPIIFDALKTVQLDVPWSQVIMPQDKSLLVRFPMGGEPHGLAAIRFNEFGTHPSLQGPAGQSQAAGIHTKQGVNVGSRNIHFDFFFVDSKPSLARMFESSFALAIPEEPLTVEESLCRDDCLCGPVRKLGLPQYKDLRTFALRLLGFISLVGQDPDVVTPLVLAKDVDRYESLSDDAARQLLVDRAQRLNGRGFDFGGTLQQQYDEAQQDSSRKVHYRKPHWALVWVGQGRSTPKMILRRGSWVNAADLFGVPTGYFGKETEEELRAILQGQDGQTEAVYFIREQGKPRVKIGRTDASVEERRKTLQTGNSDRLVIVGYIPTGSASRMEADLHRQLSHSRLAGEWFYLTEQQCEQLITDRGGILCPRQADAAAESKNSPPDY
jgi:hypothetical protein